MNCLRTKVEAVEMATSTICGFENNDFLFYDYEDNLAFKIVYLSIGNYCILVPKNYANFTIPELESITDLMSFIKKTSYKEEAKLNLYQILIDFRNKLK